MAGKRERRKKAAKAAPKILKEPSIPSNIEIEYEIEPILIQDEAFQRKFTPSEPIIEPVIAPEIQEYSENEEEDDEDVVKVRKQDSRMSIAYLKSIAPNPAVVDWVDVCAKDPYLLVTLKATRNSVPLPVHWSLKRAYLAAKRGFLKKPFELPEFIRMTGVSELRGDVEKGLKINQRYIKVGRLDIDYQKLHDAFFKLQTKPKNLTGHGDLYYEGREYESSVRSRKPGQLSDELISALNVPPNAPPPWLINMQRHGPPPSYPNLRIPGLNAPIPEGAQWGFHPGGWGKPPVDEFNRPLYGDVFGVAPRPKHKHIVVDKTMFGVIQVQEEEAQSDYEIEEESIPEEDDLEARLAELPDEHPPEILMIESFESEAVETGIETPAFIPLRKEKIDKQVIKPLYTVLTQKAGVEGFMGSMHTYDISKTVEVALNDNELEMSEEVLKRKFDEANDPGVSSKGIGFKKHEDLGDLVQEHLSKKHKKEDKKDDKKKGFKF